ncbi:MAG: outer membrane protein [Terasakiella sp.]|uniref:outer membrane protein n=1 Tax=unclassified Terasakiella TaxID=2614952 RepID=UPI003AFFA8F3
MIKKFALSLMASMSVACVAQAGGNSPYYGRVDGGIVIAEDTSFSSSATQYGVTVNATGNIEKKAGYTISGAVGRHMNNLVALELEAGYSKFDYDKVTGNLTASAGGTNYVVNGSADIDGSIQTVTAIANAIFTPLGNKKSRLSPFVGLGIGAVYSKDTIDSIGTLQVNGSESDTNLIANAIVGLDYAINKNTYVGAKYRYLWANTGQNGFDDMKAHTLTANVTFNF